VITLIWLFYHLLSERHDYNFQFNCGQIFYRPFRCVKKYWDRLSGLIFHILYLQLFSNVPMSLFELYFVFVVQLIWDRALGLPLERPKSVTMDWLESYCKKAASS
jgi:hypothetical protein